MFFGHSNFIVYMEVSIVWHCPRLIIWGTQTVKLVGVSLMQTDIYKNKLNKVFHLNNLDETNQQPQVRN